jgi:hypothetical protein
MAPPRPHPHRRFTVSEDARLQHLVQGCAVPDWIFIASLMPGRNIRQCRERWLNYLSPEIASAPWTAEEEHCLEQKVFELGTKWQIIAQFLPRRSTNQIRYHWISKCRNAVERPVQIPTGKILPQAPLPNVDESQQDRGVRDMPTDLFKFDEESYTTFDIWAGPLIF